MKPMQSSKEQNSEQRKFSSKWSHAIQEHGFTSLPNLLLLYRRELKITPSEMIIILAIESFRWDTRDPWPSFKKLARRSGFSVRQTQRLISSLEANNNLKHSKTEYKSNVYSVEPLINKIDVYATSAKPQGKPVPPTIDKTAAYRVTDMSYKEDAAINTPLRKPFMNKGVKSLKNILSDRYFNKRKPGKD